MFVLNSEITIGKVRFTGVLEVVIRKSVYSIAETATIKIPAIASLLKAGNASPELINTAAAFKEGERVNIRLGYNGLLQDEFSGFVKKLTPGMPMQIDCEGYSWLLRRNRPALKGKDSKLKTIVAAAVANLKGHENITVKCDEDLEFSGMASGNMSGFDVINYISKYTDENITFFFSDPKTIWCGRFYAAAMKGRSFNNAEVVKYRIGYNTPRANNLQQHSIDTEPGIVTYSRRTIDGIRIAHTASGVGTNAVVHAAVLNHVKDSFGMKLLAEERVRQHTYEGYEGKLTAFLQPYVMPGNKVHVSDALNAKMDGTYVVESTEVIFGIKGARRKVELGVRTSK